MTRIAQFTGTPGATRHLETALRRGGFELLPACNSIAELELQIDREKPGIVLLEPTSEVTFAVLTGLKHRAGEAPLMLWVETISTAMALQAMQLGVRGILRSTLPADVQLKSLQRVHAGELWFEKGLTRRLDDARRAALGSREALLVSLLSQGLKNWEIASSMAVSEAAVKVYLSQLFEKLGVKDRFELALYGLKSLAHRAEPRDRATEPTPDGVRLPLLPTLQ